MPKTVATWNGKIIAESDHCIAVEGNAYFPPSAVKLEFFAPSSQTSVCPWKGNCNYLDVVVDGKTNSAAAWTYKNPKSAAMPIKDHVAFWKGVVVTAAEAAKPMA